MPHPRLLMSKVLSSSENGHDSSSWTYRNELGCEMTWRLVVAADAAPVSADAKMPTASASTATSVPSRSGPVRRGTADSGRTVGVRCDMGYSLFAVPEGAEPAGLWLEVFGRVTTERVAVAPHRQRRQLHLQPQTCTADPTSPDPVGWRKAPECLADRRRSAVRVALPSATHRAVINSCDAASVGL